LYDLKQASWSWNKWFDTFLSKCIVKFGRYLKKTQHNNLIIIYIFVDDLIVIITCWDWTIQGKNKIRIWNNCYRDSQLFFGLNLNTFINKYYCSRRNILVKHKKA